MWWACDKLSTFTDPVYEIDDNDTNYCYESGYERRAALCVGLV